ncbi:MAG: hypothetical protein AAGH53_12260 [Pseudomonadota bacterium]
MSAISCVLGITFVLAIAALHISGFSGVTNEMNASDAPDFLKGMFPILFILPSLFLLTLAAFGLLALWKPNVRLPICVILAAAVFACGALALMLNGWLPMVVMGLGSALFLISGFTAKANSNAPG